jgi:hypothetical protein
MLAFIAFDPYAILAADTGSDAKPAKDAKATPPSALAGLATLARQPAQFYHPAETAWREYFNNRIAVAKQTGMMPREKAKPMAYESCITRWLDTHLPAVTPDACTHCGKPAGVIGQDAVITGNGHYFHHACHMPWMTKRRDTAIIALVDMGIQK